MKITNTTHWQTKDIARLIHRVAKDELDAGQLKHAYVKIRTGRYSGCCSYGTPLQPRVRMTLRLPHVGQVDPIGFAFIIAHELGHAKGLRHVPDMRNPRYSRIGDWRERYAYAVDYPIRRKPEQRRATGAVLFETRHDRALVMARRWKTKVKRDATLLKRWERRVRYYENKIAACKTEKAGKEIPANLSSKNEAQPTH
jgi:hypothetical protein